MPIYAYRCTCAAEWDVAKPMAELDRLEACPKCGAENGAGSRLIQRANFSGAGDWNTQCYHPALGQVVRNNAHARQIAKSRGLIEVGNEKPETLHKIAADTQRETREQRWREADRVKLYDD